MPKTHRGGEVGLFGKGAQPEPLTPAPGRSWWLGLSREEFAKQREAEISRMAGSTFGKGKKLITDSTGVAR